LKVRRWTVSIRASSVSDVADEGFSFGLHATKRKRAKRTKRSLLL